MRRKMPLKPCVRCGRPTGLRRSGRATCLVCRIQLDELRADSEMRRMGKLKGTRGRC
jgi:ribosomal protein S14